MNMLYTDVISEISDSVGNVVGLVQANAMILTNAPTTRATYPILAFSGPKTTTRLFLPVALSPS